MTKPDTLQNVASFDLDAIGQELRDESVYHRDGHAARTLLRAPDLRVLLMVIKAGARISEHHASATASVHVVSGHVRMQLPDRSVDLPAGHVLLLERGLKHDVEAVTPSAIVLTLGWHDKP